MGEILKWVEWLFSAIPLQLLEAWGRFGYLVGFILMVMAFGGFTFRVGERWCLDFLKNQLDFFV